MDRDGAVNFQNMLLNRALLAYKKQLKILREINKTKQKIAQEYRRM
jgi:hypothetical protein